MYSGKSSLLYKTLTGFNELNLVLQKLSNDVHKISNNDDVHNIIEALGRIEQRQLTHVKTNNIQHYEFRVFLQCGEDGILQFLIKPTVALTS